MNNKKCSCILPFFNEAERILPVLSVLTAVKNLSEIVCVDDGSTDNASDNIKEKFPNIVIVKNDKNMGKSDAVARGLKSVTSEYVLLMDADLYNLQTEELE